MSDKEQKMKSLIEKEDELRKLAESGEYEDTAIKGANGGRAEKD